MAPQMPAATRVALINHSSPADDVFNGQFCGGVLLEPDLVATATHCVSTLNPGLVDVVIGADNLCNTAPVDGERIQVAEIIVAEPPNGELTFMRLKKSSENKPVNIATVAPIAPGTKAVGTGWGRAEDGGIPPCGVKRIPLEIAATSDCTSYFEPLRILPSETESYICATPECHGEAPPAGSVERSTS